MQLLDSWYGEYVGGTSNKFYFLQLYSDPADTQAPVKLLAQHGRNGSSGQEQQRYASVDLNYAKTQFAKIVSEKLQKGYVPKPDPAFCTALVNQRTGGSTKTAAVGTAAASPLAAPRPVPAGEFSKLIGQREWIAQSRPADGVPAILQLGSRIAAKLLRDPNTDAGAYGETWETELRLDQLRGFAGLAPLTVEGLVVTVNDVAHFVPLDLIEYAGQEVANYDFGSRWALLNQAIAELRGNAAGPALDRWLVPQFVNGTATSPEQLMLRHSSAPYGAEPPLIQAA